MTFATSAPSDKPRASRWRERLRFVLATVMLTLLYLAIQQILLQGADQLGRTGWTYHDPVKVYAEPAAEILKQSQTREAALSPQHPLAAYRLGVQYGYVSQWLGSYGARPEAEMRELARPLERNFQAMRELAQFLGIDAVAPLPVHTAADFGHLTQRLDSDAGGVAARVEQATSPRLRHLFLFGVHAGVEMAALASPHDIDPSPASALIGKHATLSAVPPALWQPLTRLPPGDKTTRFNAYRSAVLAIEQHLISSASSTPATPP